MHYTSYVDVLLLLVRNEHVLLAERANTGYADGQWNLPSGKLNQGEDLEAALIRETREEIGLHLRREAVRMVTSPSLPATGSTAAFLVPGAAAGQAPHQETRPA